MMCCRRHGHGHGVALMLHGIVYGLGMDLGLDLAWF